MGELFSPLLRVQRLRRAQRHSLKLFVVFKYATNRLFVSRVSQNSPLQPGDPTKCMHFAGSPIRAFLPRDVTARARLRGGVNFAAYLSHGCSFPPSEYTFGGDPLEGIVLLKCGTYLPPLEKSLCLALT